MPVFLLSGCCINQRPQGDAVYHAADVLVAEDAECARLQGLDLLRAKRPSEEGWGYHHVIALRVTRETLVQLLEAL